jgi:hypothetical protein
MEQFRNFPAYRTPFQSSNAMASSRQRAVKNPPLNSDQTPHRNGHGPLLRGFAFALVLLGVCVFAWGLRYKLSLYQPPHSVGRHMPAAKLLVGKERVALPPVDLRQTTSPDSLPGVVGVWALTLFAIAVWGMGERSGFRSAISSPNLPFARLARGAPSAVRPPPSLL